ncbi:MAG: AAA family ATPase, partial [Mesorhizobium sp.]
LLPKKELVAVRLDYTYTQRDLAPYVNVALESEMTRLATAVVGNRGSQLNSSAYALGQLVGAGVLSREIAEGELYRGAAANGVLQKDGEKQTRTRIKRGLDDGIKVPRVIKERECQNDNTPLIDTSKLLKKEEVNTKVDAPAQEVNETVDTPQAPNKRERFERTWFHEIKEGEPKETFIKGVFGAGELTTVSGLPGTGKSVIVTDMACHVAAAMEWHGRKVKHGLVVYVAAERKKLTERRMMAFRKHHGIADQIPLLVIGGRLDFTKGDLKDARELIQLIREAEIECGSKCVWVIIDTLTRVFGAGDQNASKDMSKFVQSCDEVLTETKAHVTAIHHSAWSGERGKGAIDLDGAVDASFMVKKDHGKYKLVCDGTNDGEEGDILAFTMVSVELGRDEDGEPTTAPVVMQEKETKLTSGTLKGYKGDVLKALAEAVERHGIEPDGDAFPDGVLVVDEQTWRTEFYASRDSTNPAAAETARKQFQRAPKALVDEGHVNNIGLWFWPA